MDLIPGGNYKKGYIYQQQEKYPLIAQDPDDPILGLSFIQLKRNRERVEVR